MNIQEAAVSLYIRDKEVDELAKKAQRLLKTPTKTEAVRQALEHEIERAEKTAPLRERIKPIQDAVRAMGPSDPNFDMKKFMDEGWGGL
jgi:antitoxin VapB